MRFSWFGGMIQSGPGSEGDVLWKAGLLEKIWGERWVIGFEPTDRLREMFLLPVDLEETYPLLVEMVCYFRHPAVANHGQLCRKLGTLGMTGDGLENLERSIEAITGPRRVKPQGTWPG